MESIALTFIVPGVPTMSDSTKSAITDAFAVVSQHKLQNIWKAYVPPREKVSVDVQGCCVSIMDDWECAIFGNSFINCLLSLSSVHQFLNDHFNKPVGFMVLEPPMKGQTVDSMIAREKRRARTLTALKFVGAVVIGGVIGYYIDSIFALLGSLGG